MTPDRIHPLVVEADNALLASLKDLDAIVQRQPMSDATRDRLRELRARLCLHALRHISEARAACAVNLPKGTP